MIVLTTVELPVVESVACGIFSQQAVDRYPRPILFHAVFLILKRSCFCEMHEARV